MHFVEYQTSTPCATPLPAPLETVKPQPVPRCCHNSICRESPLIPSAVGRRSRRTHRTTNEQGFIAVTSHKLGCSKGQGESHKSW